MESLILNPTENIKMDISRNYDILEGYYVSDEIRDKNSKIIFAGRNDYTYEINEKKKTWCSILNAYDIDFRFLSGLHAHITTFMSLGNIGDKILLLPEQAGGHYSTEAILKRLGYSIVKVIPDSKNYCVDIERTMDIINQYKPRFAFIDRSEGLYYENFSWIKDTSIPYSVFDSSQYLTQILSNLYTSPFNWGFDLILSSTHKNFPGPQKAFLATKENNDYWEKICAGSATYISNSHPKDMLGILQTIENIGRIIDYSKLMLEISLKLEKALHYKGFPVIQKDYSITPSQHIWSRFNNQNECYRVFADLEKLGIYTNYRLLPYNIGYGLRLGVGAAIQSGLREEHIETLASIMASCYKEGYSETLYSKSQELIRHMSSIGKYL